MKFRVAVLATALLAPMGALALSPAEREDERIAKEKVLRAADQMEVLLPTVEKLQTDVVALRKDLTAAQAENEALRKALDELQQARAKDRDAIIDEVSKVVEESTKPKAPAKKETPAPAAKPKTESSPEKKSEAKPTGKSEAKPAAKPAQEKGFEHVVESGQTLSAIAKAFRDQGIKVTVEDIIKSNKLPADGKLKVGQKLFIPKK